MSEDKKMSLTMQIMIAMVVGIICGVIINTLFASTAFVQDYIVGGVLDVVGSIFVASLKMMVVPLVFVSLVCGVTSLSDTAALGRLGGKAIGLYLMTTAIAVTIAISVALLISPGDGVQATAEVSYEAKEARR